MTYTENLSRQHYTAVGMMSTLTIDFGGLRTAGTAINELTAASHDSAASILITLPMSG